MKLASLIPLLALGACDADSTNVPVAEAPDYMILGKIQAYDPALVMATGASLDGSQPIVRVGDCFINQNIVPQGFSLGSITMTDPTKSRTDGSRTITLVEELALGFYLPHNDNEQTFSKLQISNDGRGPLGAFTSDLAFPTPSEVVSAKTMFGAPNMIDPAYPFAVSRTSVNGSMAAVIIRDFEHTALCFDQGTVTVPASVIAGFTHASIWIGDAQLEEQQLGPTDLVTFAFQGDYNVVDMRAFQLAQ